METLTVATKVAIEVAMTVIIATGGLGATLLYLHRREEPLWYGNITLRQATRALSILSAAFSLWLILTALNIVW